MSDDRAVIFQGQYHAVVADPIHCEPRAFQARERDISGTASGESTG